MKLRNPARMHVEVQEAKAGSIHQNLWSWGYPRGRLTRFSNKNGLSAIHISWSLANHKKWKRFCWCTSSTQKLSETRQEKRSITMNEEFILAMVTQLPQTLLVEQFLRPQSELPLGQVLSFHDWTRFIRTYRNWLLSFWNRLEDIRMAYDRVLFTYEIRRSCLMSR